MQATGKPEFTLVGAGLVGSLLAIFLARRGYNVRLLERRPDMRSHAVSAGRSINLAISTRGITALQRLGLDKEVLAQAVPMKGRMIHAQDCELTFQPYGTNDSEYINSISRATLNKILMTRAEETGRVRIEFNRRVTGVNIDASRLHVSDEETHAASDEPFDIVIGTDGSASAIRAEMEKLPGYSMHSYSLDYGYKELVIPPSDGGGFRIERNALHIWPRGTYMLIALPNYEGSFTCTLFLPFAGGVSFERLTTRDAVTGFFKEHFPDSVPLIEDLEDAFFENPTGHMTTVKCNRWNVGGKVLLMGDAAHGIVPFFGQGMNCGFEDCTIFDELIEMHTLGNGSTDWEALFDDMTRVRVPNTDAIADMAVENFVEMRDKVGDKQFLLEKAVEKVLMRRFPGRYISRYSLVTFSNVPYKLALDAGIVEEQILKQLCNQLQGAEDVDTQLAGQLIDERLAPLLVPYARQLGAVPAH